MSTAMVMNSVPEVWPTFHRKLYVTRATESGSNILPITYVIISYKHLICASLYISDLTGIIRDE
jgi:hypothetical protein